MIATDRDTLLRVLNAISQEVVSERWEEGHCALPACSVPMSGVFMAAGARRAFPLCFHHLKQVAA